MKKILIVVLLTIVYYIALFAGDGFNPERMDYEDEDYYVDLISKTIFQDSTISVEIIKIDTAYIICSINKEMFVMNACSFRTKDTLPQSRIKLDTATEKIANILLELEGKSDYNIILSGSPILIYHFEPFYTFYFYQLTEVEKEMKDKKLIKKI